MVCENYPITSAVLCDIYVAKAKCPGHKLNSFTNMLSHGQLVFIFVCFKFSRNNIFTARSLFVV